MSRPTFDRRRLMLGMGATFMMSGTKQAIAGGDFVSRLAEMQRDDRLPGLHALLVAHGDRILFEHYDTGEDESWGRPLGRITFGPDVLHDLRSVTKSIVGLLYGIALADGKVPPPDSGLYEQFPEYADLAGDPERDRLTVAHVLSMTMGTDWDELTVPYGDPRNSEIAMEMSSDRYRYVLDRPIVRTPGLQWTYNGGATTLLGRLIEKGTGEKLPGYGRRALFDPMGLGPTEWSNGLKGEPAAASGLRLRPRDLMRIGQMVLANGVWQGKQIVPADWLKKSTTAAVAIDGGVRRYGWHWYLSELPVGTPRKAGLRISGIGWGGQRLDLVPALGLAVVVHFGNYRRPIMEQGVIANRVLTDLVLPSLG